MLVYDAKKRISFEELFNHDWLKNPLSENLEASVFLKSQYDWKRIEKKKEEKQKKMEESSPKVVPAPKKEVPKNDPIEIVEDPEFIAIPELEKKRQVQAAAFLGKLYEIFRNQIRILKQNLDTVNQITVPNSADDDPVSIVQALLMLQILKLHKEALTARFRVLDETSNENLCENDFKTIWDLIWKNKDSLEQFYNTEESSMPVLDLYNDLKENFSKGFEDVSAKITSLQESFDKFKGNSLEQLLFDCLVHLSKHKVSFFNF